jgi:hypothetical protein
MQEMSSATLSSGNKAHLPVIFQVYVLPLGCRKGIVLEQRWILSLLLQLHRSAFFGDAGGGGRGSNGRLPRIDLVEVPLILTAAGWW